MACRRGRCQSVMTSVRPEEGTKETVRFPRQLWFGVDSQMPADDILQNNISLFEWVKRNKRYPIFWGRPITGEYALTKREIEFLHTKACKIAPIYKTSDAKVTEEDGTQAAKKCIGVALALGIPIGKALFCEIDATENATTDYMRSFAESLMTVGYIPAFKANTDAQYDFDREFSRGMQTDRQVFEKCLVWAVAPTLAEYDRITTTHLIHPDNWTPFAPSGITRNDIIIWQYGKGCHPILDDRDREVTFNVNLAQKERVLIDKMY